MTKVRKDGYSEAQQKELLKVSRGKTATNKLKALAKKWKKTHSAVHQKWNSLLSAAKKTPKHVVVASTPPDGIKPMVFKDVEFKDPRSVTTAEELSMRAGLDAAMKGPLLQVNRGLVFPRRYQTRAKKYLEEKFPANKFAFCKNDSDKDGDTVILVKRV